MKLDTKSVLLGVLFSLTLIFGFGYTGITSEDRFVSGYIDWAIVVPSNGKVLARAYDGKAFIIDVDSSKATRVEYDKTKLLVTTEQIVLADKD
jgi:hypothetical protein